MTTTLHEITSQTARLAKLRRTFERVTALYTEALCRDAINVDYEPALDTELSKVASVIGITSFAELKERKLAECLATKEHDNASSHEDVEDSEDSEEIVSQELEGDESTNRDRESLTEQTDNTPVNQNAAVRLSLEEWKIKYHEFFYQAFVQKDIPAALEATSALEEKLRDAKREKLSKEHIESLEGELKAAKKYQRALEQKSVNADVESRASELMKIDFERMSGTPTPAMIHWRIAKLEQESFDVVRNLDYFPTPPDVAARVVDAADIKPGMSVLEPSAGKGNIADIIKERFGSSVQLQCVEYSDHNTEILQLKGYEVIKGDFLETGGARYDRIVMNPPYMKGIDWVHIRHAYYDCLKPDGLLVALIPAGSVTGSGREAIANEEFIKERDGSIEVIPYKDYNRNMERQELTINIALITIKGREEQKLERTKRRKSQETSYMELPAKGSIELPDRSSVAMDAGYVKPEIVTAQAHLVPKEETIANSCPHPLSDILLPHQKFGVNLAIHALESRGGFLLADGTGAGKTIQMLTVATHFWRKHRKPVVIFTIDDRVIKTSFMEDAIKIGMKAPEYKATTSVASADRPERPSNYQGLYDRFENESASASADLPQVVMGDAKGFKLKPGINMFTYTALSLFKGSEEAENKYNLAKGHRKFNETFWSRIAAAGRDALKKKENRQQFMEQIGMEATDAENARTLWFERVSKVKYEDTFALHQEYAQYVGYTGAMPKIENAFVNYIKAEDARNESIKTTIGEVINDASLVIFDEAHKIKNLADQEEKGVGRAYYASFITRNTKRVMFATATPCDRPYDMLYLQRAGLFKDEQQFRNVMRMVGIYYDPERRNERGELVRRGRWKIDRSDKQREFANINVSNLFNFITREGCMIRREIQYTNLDVNMVTVTVPDSVKQELAAITQECTSKDEKGRVKVDKLKELLRHTEAMEGYKLDAAIELTGKELAEGRNVVIFTSFVDEEEREDGDDKLGSVRILKNRLSQLYGENAVGVLVSAQGGYETFRRLENVAQFQSGQRRVLIGTITSGGTGVNLDDQIGNAPRTIIIITAPLTFINVMQGIGRIVRANTKSRSRVNFLFAETDNPEPDKRHITIERWLKNILATKFKTLRAAVKGEIDVLDPDALARLEQTGSGGLATAIEEAGNESKREHSWYTKSAKKIEGWTLPNQIPIRIERTADRYEHFVYISARTRDEMESWVAANRTFIEHWGLERNVDANYQRYNGLHYGRKFRSGSSKDLAQSYDVWNALLNLVQPEDARWMDQETSAFNVSDAVVATTNIIYANVAPGARGVIKAILPLLKGNAGKDDLFTYQYDVLFENGYTAVNLDQWQIRKTENTDTVFAKYRKGDTWQNDRMRLRVIDVDVKNGDTVYLVEQSYTNHYSYLDPDFHNMTEAVLERTLHDQEFTPYAAPQLSDPGTDRTHERVSLEEVPDEIAQTELSPINTDEVSTLSSSKPSELGFYSIADATKVKARPLRLDKTKPLFKKLCQRFNMLIWGLPGQGKSSFLLMLASDLAKTGKVLLILREERIESGRVGERAKRMNIAQSSDIILNDSLSLSELRQLLTKNPSLQFVGIDSLQRWDKVTEENIEQLIGDFPNVSFVFIAQSNKAGKEYRGFSRLSNTVDTVVNVSSGTATASKHRDGDASNVFKIFKHNFTESVTSSRKSSSVPFYFSGLRI